MNNLVLRDLRKIMDPDFSDDESLTDEDELIIDLRFIIDECPSTRIVRDFMRENIKSVNEDDPFFKMLQEQIN